MRLDLEQRQMIQYLAQQKLGDGVRVKVFGSRLNDRVRGGDLDLLLETPTPISLVQKAELGLALESSLNIPVDMVILIKGKPVSAFQRLALSQARDLLEGNSVGI